MNNISLAKDYLSEANLRVETAEIVISKEAYAYCVRQCQEAVELALKAALRIVGLDYPKWHDIGNVLIKEKIKFPHPHTSLALYISLKRKVLVTILKYLI